MLGSPRSLSYRLALVAGFVTVLTSTLPTLAGGFGTPDKGAYLAAMTLYCSLMMWTMWPRECRPENMRVNWYFLVQLVLLGIAESTQNGEGITWLATMPLLGQIVAQRDPETPFWHRLVWMSLLFALVSYFKWKTFGFQGYLYWSGPMLGSYIFVYGFTWMTVEAERARRSSEGLTQELMEANARLQLQARHIERLTRERERIRVARELHDSLGHGLTALAVQLEVAEALPDRNGEKAKRAIERARILAQSALQDVRVAVGDLRDGPAVRPLIERVQELLRPENLTDLEVKFLCEGEPVDLPPDTEQALFRALQEGITNVRRHSEAKQVTVRLDFSSASHVVLEISDPGPTRATVAGTSGGGYGLRGLAERVQALQGTVESGGLPGGGFRLTVRVSK